jgi:deazaflavin-dependent oxidoreductase (nitroreductase family)
MKRPNAVQRLLHRLLMLRPVTAVLVRFLHHADNFLLKLTRGKHTVTKIVGLPIIQLTTIGAKTGTPRTSPLVGLFDGERIALIGSNFGQKHSPGWYYNLKANPKCSVLIKGDSVEYIGHEVFGEEYQKYWEMAVSWYAGYEKYKQRASHRHIPVMVLEPM